MLTSPHVPPRDIQSWHELPTAALIALAERVDQLISEQRALRLTQSTGGSLMSTECGCGCGRAIEPKPRGRHPRFATEACRAAAYRRRQAGAPEDTPRQAPQGRRRLLGEAINR